jgi:hypothetical protein
MKSLACHLFHRKHWKCLTSLNLTIGPEYLFMFCTRCLRAWEEIEEP